MPSNEINAEFAPFAVLAARAVARKEYLELRDLIDAAFYKALEAGSVAASLAPMAIEGDIAQISKQWLLGWG